MRPADAPRAADDHFHGWLVVDKPAGWTSHDVVARARRLLGERRIGHAGTLDPAATGVLPLAVGSATKVVEYLAEASKTYLAEVTFGVRTDSHDGDGLVISVTDASALRREDVEAALAPFRGAIAQVPPMHAAIKVGGRRLYELARRGEEVERPPRAVTISLLEIADWRPPTATLCVDCSKGTYVRALARDIGDALGVGAYLSNLVRVRTGPFCLCETVTLGELERASLPWAWPELALHPDAVLADWPAALLDDRAAGDWLRGNSPRGAAPAVGPFRAYGPDGTWLGLGRAEAAAWRPSKVVGAA